MGMTDIPTVRVDHLSPTQIRAYVIADNRLAEKAGWDPVLLALELQELSVQPNFDVTVTGFEMAEIDLIVSEASDKEPDDADVIPEIDRSFPAVSRLGDCWQIGDHFLLCGDALKPKSYERLLGGKRAQLVFTDPPYNVRIAGNVSGLGKARHREFAMASGEMNRREFTNFLRRALTNLAEFSIDGSIHFVCMDWRHIRELTDLPMMHIPNSKTSAFGRKAMPEWVRFTDPPTSSFLYTKTDVPSTSTMLNSGALEEAERIFGNMSE